MKLFMIRHGEPDYMLGDERGFIGHGHDLAPLTAAGIEQVENAAMDGRLNDAEIIVASPYTRALQTAAIISRVTGIKLVVEVDLREWQPDLTFQYKNFDESLESYRDYDLHNGEYPCGETRKWERKSDVKKRVGLVIEKYAGKYEKIIMVCHGMVMCTVCDQKDIHYAEIIEYEI